MKTHHDPKIEFNELSEAYFSLKAVAQTHQEDFPLLLEVRDLQMAADLSDSLSSKLREFRARERSSLVELPNGESILLVEHHALQALAALADTPFDQMLSKAFANDGQLYSIDLSFLGLNDISPLRSCTALEKLLLNSSSKPDLSPLNSLPKLRVLDIAASGLSDISPLAHCGALEELLLYLSPLEDISPLSNCPRLTTLSLTGTYVEDLTPLERCPELKDLALSNNRAKDLTPLAHCKKLAHLQVGRAVSDLSPLVSCQELTQLSLDDSTVQDLSPLQHCLKLTELHLARTPVSDLSPLAHCPNLEWVTLRDASSVTDLSPLTALPYLRRINIEGLSIPEDDPVRTKLREWGVTGA